MGCSVALALAGFACGTEKSSSSGSPAASTADGPAAAASSAGGMGGSDIGASSEVTSTAASTTGSSSGAVGSGGDGSGGGETATSGAGATGGGPSPGGAAGAPGGSGGFGGTGGAENSSCIWNSSDEIPASLPTRDLEVHGEGFDEYEGLDIRLTIFIDGEFRVVAEQRISTGSFSFSVSDGVTHYTNLALYVDRNADDNCDDDEPAWAFTTGPDGCSFQPCPNQDGVVVENVRLPLEECGDCNSWMPLPLTSIGLEGNCDIGAGRDLTETLPCPM